MVDLRKMAALSDAAILAYNRAHSECAKPMRIHLVSRVSYVLLLVMLMGPSIAADDPPKPTSPGELQLDGIIVDPLGGGVSQAEVRIELPEALPDDPPLAESVSQGMGKISMTVKRPAGDALRVRIRKSGYAEYVDELDISDPDEPPFIDATLQGAGRIQGMVRIAATSQPAAGISVECRSSGKRLAATTDEHGAFTIESVYYGAAMLTVGGDGYARQRLPVEVGNDPSPVEILLAPERCVELEVVTNTNEPAPGVVVEAIAEPDAARFTADADDRGRAVLHGLGDGCTGLDLRLNGERYLAMRGYDEHVSLPVARAAPSTQPAPVRVRLRVVLASSVRGRITDARDGQPIAGVRVTAGREPRYDMPVDWSDADGTYELTGGRPGIVAVTFQHDGYATAFSSADLDTGKCGTLDAVLEQGVPIGGTVVDEHGLPVDQVRVHGDRWRDHRTLGLRAVTGADGKFHFPHAPSGTIGFRLIRPGYGEPVESSLTAGRSDHFILLQGAQTPVASPSRTGETKLKIGQQVPDLAMTAMDGTKYELSQMRGKYVLLDCWASWCGPCMGELPNVKAVYAANKDRADFLMIGISLDTDAGDLKRTIASKGITWPQVFGPRSGASEAFEELDGTGIPYICLIGPDGKLLAQHLRGPGMVDEVRRQSKKTVSTTTGP